MKKVLFMIVAHLLSVVSCNAMSHDQSRESLVLKKDICWICERKIEKIPHYYPYVPHNMNQDYCHADCYNLISPAFLSACEKLNKTFCWCCYLTVFGELIRRVQLDAKPQTILAYEQKEGIDALQTLFDFHIKPASEYILEETAKTKKDMQKTRAQEKERIGKQD